MRQNKRQTKTRLGMTLLNIYFVLFDKILHFFSPKYATTVHIGPLKFNQPATSKTTNQLSMQAFQ
jgi:hypothetical protein